MKPGKRLDNPVQTSYLVVQQVVNSTKNWSGGGATSIGLVGNDKWDSNQEALVMLITIRIVNHYSEEG